MFTLKPVVFFSPKINTGLHTSYNLLKLIKIILLTWALSEETTLGIHIKTTSKWLEDRNFKFPWPYFTFPDLEKKWKFPDFPDLWEPCLSTSKTWTWGLAQHPDQCNFFLGVVISGLRYTCTCYHKPYCSTLSSTKSDRGNSTIMQAITSIHECLSEKKKISSIPG